ncbi:MAG TPA: hypothetical protein VKY51_01685 [Fredinandcohnia sp.]|nr:hypothetical protein [Fredinandcohnia sp.]
MRARGQKLDARDDRPTDSGQRAIVHDLRNAATSVGFALHSLRQSREIQSSAGQACLRIAHQELETIRRLLDELESLGFEG